MSFSKLLTEEYLDTLTIKEIAELIDILNEEEALNEGTTNEDRETIGKVIKKRYQENFELAQESLNRMAELEEECLKEK